jgi:hypothetical protein
LDQPENVADPLLFVQNALDAARRHYTSGSYAAAAEDLRRAEQTLRAVAESQDDALRIDAETLALDLHLLRRKIDRADEATAQALDNAWLSAGALVRGYDRSTATPSVTAR